jgi:hypothetical protein
MRVISFIDGTPKLEEHDQTSLPRAGPAEAAGTFDGGIQ